MLSKNASQSNLDMQPIEQNNNYTLITHNKIFLTGGLNKQSLNNKSKIPLSNIIGKTDKSKPLNHLNIEKKQVPKKK